MASESGKFSQEALAIARILAVTASNTKFRPKVSIADRELALKNLKEALEVTDTFRELAHMGALKFCELIIGIGSAYLEKVGATPLLTAALGGISSLVEFLKERPIEEEER